MNPLKLIPVCYIELAVAIVVFDKDNKNVNAAP
jgi:hypothetical protein